MDKHTIMIMKCAITTIFNTKYELSKPVSTPRPHIISYTDSTGSFKQNQRKQIKKTWRKKCKKF